MSSFFSFDALAIQSHIADLPAAGARAAILSQVRERYQAGRLAVFAPFEDGAHNGDEAAARLAQLHDELLHLLLMIIAQRWPHAKMDALALVGVGGYGRGLMAPHSDLDLLILVPDTLSSAQTDAIDFILYFLWDMQIKLGHAIRSPHQCITACSEDWTIRTALSDARFIAGNQTLFDKLQARMTKLKRKDQAGFIKAKLEERAARHAKVGHIRNALEPDIKEGKGGFRDLQSLMWIAREAYGLQQGSGRDQDNWSALVQLGVLSPAQRAAVRRGETFLWTLRFHLHLAANRAEDKLTFDKQQVIADKLRYADDPQQGERSVERFMRHYFRTAKAIGTLSDFILADIDERKEQQSALERLQARLRPAPKQYRQGFELIGGRLAAPSDDWFQRHPLDLLRIYLVALQEGLEVQPRSQVLISQSLNLIDVALQQSSEANQIFLAILTFEATSPKPMLTAMSDSGVLGRFIPDFERINGMMQFDRYHHYTVDEHTLFAIDNLHRMEQGELQNDAALSSELFPKLVARTELYVATFLHDIAKGRGGDHSLLGAEVARTLCPRLGLSDDESENVAFLVAEHLTLSTTCHKRDLEDPETIEYLANKIQSIEALRQLMILTAADIMAVGPGRYTNWKAVLLRNAYYRTAEHLSGGLITQGRDQVVQHRLDCLRHDLSGKLSAQQIDDFIAVGHQAYWLSYSPRFLYDHAMLLQAPAEDDVSHTLLRSVWNYDAERDLTVATIYTPDHNGLFAMLAGAMALENLSIEQARIHTLGNGMALDTFWIKRSDGRGQLSPTQEQAIKQRIIAVLSQGGLGLGEALARNAPNLIDKRLAVFAVPTRVLFDNKDSKRHTILEVSGNVRHGVLYRMADAISAEGLSIQNAKISSFGTRFVDVFYVLDALGGKLEDPDRQARLRSRIINALNHDG